MKYFLGLFLFMASLSFGASDILVLRARVPASFDKNILLDPNAPLPKAYTVIKDAQKGQITIIHR